MPTLAQPLTLAQARALWIRRQGLDAPREGGAIARTLAETGWVRTLGGVDAYLAIKARMPHVTREAVDAALAEGDIAVSPAARGCIYLVPRDHHALAMRVAEALGRARTERDWEKAGLAKSEIAAVADAAVQALEAGPMTTDALRKALPKDLLRPLGDAGKKVGLSSPLPPALRVLEFAGRIGRMTETGRLDTERYVWRLLDASPLAGDTDHDRHARLAEVFFRAAAPASVKDFAAWSGLSVKDAKAAVAALPLVPVAVEGLADPYMAFEGDDMTAPLDGTPVAFLPFEDNLLALHGGPAAFVDPAYHHLEAPTVGPMSGRTLGAMRHFSVRTLLVGDRVRGFWEYDPDAGEIVVGAFDALTASERRAVEAAAPPLAAFIRGELGHASSFVQDKPELARARVAALRAMG